MDKKDKFLEMVAADLYLQPNVDLAHTVVVFPGKRAMLYFNEYLLAQSANPDAPLWAPTYMSISDLFASMSGKRLGDPIKLICLLHQVFNQTVGKPEPLDSFYFWGEMLLSDFNDVDKSMADAKALFRNLEELRQMDDLSYIDEEQRRAIEHFFGLFKKEGGSTELQKNFSQVWNYLYGIYQAYRDLLTVEGIAYEGMLYREVVESLDVDHLPFDKYVFVGFNVLTPVEKKLFSMLKDEGKALFYWDYDLSYIDNINHEAATFLSQNVKQFPSPLGKELFSALSQPKEIQYVEASTENAQARYLTEWLPANITTPQRDTAIVLCNEDILSPVLHSLPTVYKDKDADKDVSIDYNITMGYPLVQTPAYSFVCAILEAHAQGYKPERAAFRLSQIRNLLNHPFTLRLSQRALWKFNELTSHNIFYPTPEELKADIVYSKEKTVQMDDRFKHLLTPATDKRALCQLLAWALQEVGKTFRSITDDQQQEDPLLIAYKEAIYEAYTKVNRFLSLIDDGTLADLQTPTFCSLLQRALSSVRIPFHGEPAEGVQIMGVIETRNLDFRHFVMLSVNEGFMPRVANDVSFIPYNLRKAFGLTTIEHKISVYAYYFYRLLQRAETVTLVYNAVTDDKHKGEMSRFMLQLLVSSPHHHITRRQLSAHQNQQTERTIVVPKTPDVMEALRRRFDVSENEDSVLSPSALNAYIDCPLHFYFKYVAGLRSDDEVDEDIGSAMFGTIFHQTAQNIYNDLLPIHGGLIERQMLEPFLTDEKKIRDYVDNAFKECFFKVTHEDEVSYNGLQLINRDVIAKFVSMLLEIDRDMTPFTYVAAEQEVRESFTVEAAGLEPFNINIGGTIDRQDSKDSTELRIVDYKTGDKATSFKNVADLFLQQKTRAKYIFQIFLYSTIIKAKEPQKKILPQVLYIHHALAPDYKKCIQQEESYRKYKDYPDLTDEDASEFRSELTKLLNEQLFNPSLPFKQTEVEDNCKYCDFKALCHKEADEHS